MTLNELEKTAMLARGIMPTRKQDQTNDLIRTAISNGMPLPRFTLRSKVMVDPFYIVVGLMSTIEAVLFYALGALINYL